MRKKEIMILQLYFSIYPSPEQDSGGHTVPISNNTGSLPDLTNLNFPPPLTTPIDIEDQSGQAAAAAAAAVNAGYIQGNPGNLSPTAAQRIGGP